MKKYIYLLFVLLLVGCSKEEKTANIKMHCNGIVSNFEVKKNDVLSCKLLNENYEFKVKNITDDEINIEANKFGLGDEDNFDKEEKNFKISKNTELNLVTQTLDYQESVSFVWK